MAKKATQKTGKSSKKKATVTAAFDLLNGTFVSVKEAEEAKKEEERRENEIRDQFKVKKTGPFDIINMMFYDRNGFDALKDDVLKANYFIINRRFAIMFPQQAAKLSLMGINEAQVIRFWANFMKTKGYTRMPRELYLKSEKNGIAQVDIEDFDDEMLAGYMKKYNLSRRDLVDMLKFYNKETVEEIRHYVSVYSPEEQAKLFTKEKGSKSKFENDES